jgi:hypothetical protein
MGKFKSDYRRISMYQYEFQCYLEAISGCYLTGKVLTAFLIFEINP